MKYISLFSSAGIGTYGLYEDGHICIATNEILYERIKFQILNNIGVDNESYIYGDITDENIKNKIFSQVFKYGDPDIVIATPPCQGMSLLNFKKKEKDKFRNSLIIDSLEIIKKTKPKLFIFENIQNFLKTTCLYNGNFSKIKDVINNELRNYYSIAYKVLNLKFVGSNSSRTRTIVIGLRRDLSQHYSPWELFPDKVKKISTLFEVIGDLKSLSWGEIFDEDFYHAFRTYDEKMRPWISNLEPGQSAFDNELDKYKPHKVINDKLILNKNLTKDKYKRQFPDKVAQCIMTRNDQLASQNTIHPFDDRVFSIRELMRLMTIPETFKFFELTNEKFWKLNDEQRKKYYKKSELNIRKTIGEAVPTFLFKKIVNNFVKEENKIKLKNKKDIYKYILKNNLKETHDLLQHVHLVTRKSLNLLFEELEIDTRKTGLYFTNPDIVTDLINDLNINERKIIEPSVGLGSFIIPLLKSFPETPFNIKVFDINNIALEILKKFIGKNKNITYFNKDFLSHTNVEADLIIGNPPYVQITNNSKYQINSSARNLFELFTYKSIEISKRVVFVLPKYILYNHKYSNFRIFMNNNGIFRFWDYKKMLFPNAKIETIVLELNGKNNKKFIVNGKSNMINLLWNDRSSIWTIYPEKKIIEYGKKLKYDNNITSLRLLKYKKTDSTSDGTIKVYTSANLRGDKNFFKVRDFKFKKEQYDYGIFVPNMTKNIVAIKKPKGTIWNGSLALVKIDNLLIDNALKTWNSKDFKDYINMLRSDAERSINIDKEIIKHFGVYDYGK